MDPRSQNLNIAHPTSCASPHPSLLATQTLHPTSHVSPFTDQDSHLTHHASDDPPFASFLASQASRLTPDTSNLHITPYTSHLTPHSALFTPHTSPPPPHRTAHLAHLTVVNFPVLGGLSSVGLMSARPAPRIADNASATRSQLSPCHLSCPC